MPIEADPTLWDISIPQSLYNDIKAYVDIYNRLYDTYGKRTADDIIRNGIYPDKRDGLGSPIRERMGVVGIGAMVKFLGLSVMEKKVNYTEVLAKIKADMEKREAEKARKLKQIDTEQAKKIAEMLGNQS